MVITAGRFSVLCVKNWSSCFLSYKSNNYISWRSLVVPVRLFGMTHVRSIPDGPRPVVFAGPSGAGKSTLLKQLLSENHDVFGFSVSHTTRKPRKGETNGREYHFVTVEEMKAAIANGEFIEHAEFSGNMYGTSKKAVEDVQKRGQICVLDIDMQGVRSVKNTDLNPKYILVKPPSMNSLEKRLRDRGTESEASLQKRLSIAQTEMEFAEQPGAFQYVIVNDDKDEAYAQLKDILVEDIEEARKKLAKLNHSINGVIQ